MEITSKETLTEHQREEPSKAPVEVKAKPAAIDEVVEDVARQDGLVEAVEDVGTAESTLHPD